MRHSILFIGILLSIILASCSTPGNQTLLSQGGFPYYFINDVEGTVIVPEQFAYFHYTQSMGDTILGSTRDSGAEPVLQIPNAETLQTSPNPIIDGLSLMSEGDSLRISIHRDSIPNIPEDLKNYEYLNFDIKLETIATKEEVEAKKAIEKAEKQELTEAYTARIPAVKSLVEQTVKDYNTGKLTDQIAVTSSGLKYLKHEAGTGAPTKKGDLAKVMYYGVLVSDGTKFDDSFSRGEPIQFPLGVGKVIRGWDEGLALLKKGAKASFFIPSDLAYGEAGSPPAIPPNSELYFYVEVE